MFPLPVGMKIAVMKRGKEMEARRCSDDNRTSRMQEKRARLPLELVLRRQGMRRMHQARDSHPLSLRLARRREKEGVRLGPGGNGSVAKGEMRQGGDRRARHGSPASAAASPATPSGASAAARGSAPAASGRRVHRAPHGGERAAEGPVERHGVKRADVAR